MEMIQLQIKYYSFGPFMAGTTSGLARLETTKLVNNVPHLHPVSYIEDEDISQSVQTFFYPQLENYIETLPFCPSLLWIDLLNYLLVIKKGDSYSFLNLGEF